MLKVEHLAAGYGDTQVLFDVTFSVGAGEVVALLGRNGMGKTTTVRTIMGQLPVRAGSLTIDRTPTAGMAPFRIAQLGLGLVPEGRQIFPTLTVEENLLAAAAPRFGDAWTLRSVFDLFPRLGERRRQTGRTLSGGEQQMLAIGRALMTNPRLLILDEATEGLAPLIRAEIWDCLARLRGQRLSILLIDRSLQAMMPLADRMVILEKGRTVWTGSPAALAQSADIREHYLYI